MSDKREKLSRILTGLASQDPRVCAQATDKWIAETSPLIPDGYAVAPEHLDCGLFTPLDVNRLVCDRSRIKVLLNAIGSCIEKEDIQDVIDAGTGSAILALKAALSDKVRRVCGLEFFPPTVVFARRVVDHFDMGDKVHIVECDATIYRPDFKANLLISETLNRGLLKEKFLDILKNLRPFLDNRRLIIPRSIVFSLYVSWRDTDGELQYEYLPFATLNSKDFDLDVVKGTVQLPNNLHADGILNVGIQTEFTFYNECSIERSHIHTLEDPVKLDLGNLESPLRPGSEVKICIWPGTERCSLNERVLGIRF